MRVNHHWALSIGSLNASKNTVPEMQMTRLLMVKKIRLIHQDIISYDVAISSTDQWPYATQLLQHLEMSQLEAMIVSSWDCTQSWRTKTS